MTDGRRRLVTTSDTLRSCEPTPSPSYRQIDRRVADTFCNQAYGYPG